MRYITDWHVHSKYSRACSKDLELPKIAEWCERKGINIVATGDWTHPKWFAHLEENLEEVREGIYRLRTSTGGKLLCRAVNKNKSSSLPSLNHSAVPPNSCSSPRFHRSIKKENKPVVFTTWSGRLLLKLVKK